MKRTSKARKEFVHVMNDNKYYMQSSHNDSSCVITSNIYNYQYLLVNLN